MCSFAMPLPLIEVSFLAKRSLPSVLPPAHLSLLQSRRSWGLVGCFQRPHFECTTNAYTQRSRQRDAAPWSLLSGRHLCLLPLASCLPSPPDLRSSSPRPRTPCGPCGLARRMLVTYGMGTDSARSLKPSRRSKYRNSTTAAAAGPRRGKAGEPTSGLCEEAEGCRHGAPPSPDGQIH